MTTTDAESILAETNAVIGRLMPTALDMIATVVADPGASLESYDALTAVAEQESPLLLLAILRAAAGLAHVLEMTPADVRALGRAKPDDGPTPE